MPELSELKSSVALLQAYEDFGALTSMKHWQDALMIKTKTGKFHTSPSTLWPSHGGPIAISDMETKHIYSTIKLILKKNAAHNTGWGHKFLPALLREYQSRKMQAP